MTQSISSAHIPTQEVDPYELKAWIKAQALDLGFADCVIARPDAQAELPRLQKYLEQGFHGDMKFLEENLEKRANPALLVPNTQSIICVRMNYLVETPEPRLVPDFPNSAVIARYARGRDYHKVLRGRLKTLSNRIREKVGEFESRPFADSAPVFEKSLAESAGMGWTGKHTLLINKKSGSFFVLGELFSSLALPFDDAATSHCGSCTSCIDICPTQAIVAPYQLDARKCIAYLTIEFQGVIPVELRRGIGNRVFGCDDCQLICPWNSFAQTTTVSDFNPRHDLDRLSLIELWRWDEATFMDNTEGSPLRRTGYESFMRNIAIGIGNAPYDLNNIEQLQNKRESSTELVKTHIDWAIQEQLIKKDT